MYYARSAVGPIRTCTLRISTQVKIQVTSTIDRVPPFLSCSATTPAPFRSVLFGTYLHSCMEESNLNMKMATVTREQIYVQRGASDTTTCETFGSLYV
jgi:hypothetical protein